MLGLQQRSSSLSKSGTGSLSGSISGKDSASSSASTSSASSSSSEMMLLEKIIYTQPPVLAMHYHYSALCNPLSDPYRYAELSTLSIFQTPSNSADSVMVDNISFEGSQSVN